MSWSVLDMVLELFLSLFDSVLQKEDFYPEYNKRNSTHAAA